jgi:Ppx/GppA phosphatase family
MLILNLLFVLLSATFGHATAPPKAVIDLGSGSVKMVAPALGADESLEFALEAGKDIEGSIPQEMINTLITRLRQLRGTAFERARKLGFKEIELTVVATHALRTATNREDVLRQLRAKGFSVSVLTQEDEGRLARRAVAEKAQSLCKDQNFWVWDVGGGSTQLAGPDQKVIPLRLGAEKAKTEVLRNLNRSGRPPESCSWEGPATPNPVPRDQLAPLLEHLRTKWQALPWAKDQAHQCWIGVGGVHHRAILGRLQQHWPKLQNCACAGKMPCAAPENRYRRQDVQCLVEYLSDRNDCDPEIKGPFSEMAVTNPLMILTAMQLMSLEQVHVIKANMGHALVSDPKVKSQRFSVPQKP